MSLESRVREVIAAGGEIPREVREAVPEIFRKPLSPAARDARLSIARMELILAEVRREMGLADDEREPDDKLIYEISDVMGPEPADALRHWFRLRLGGKLPTESAQVLAAVSLRQRSPATNPELIENEVERILSDRGQSPRVQ